MNRLGTLALLLMVPVAMAAGPPGKPVFPGKSWTTAPPETLGLDPAALRQFQEAVGGRGCVVRDGVMAFSWGKQSQRGDVASACKPVLGHFLTLAALGGRLGPKGLDTPVREFEPALDGLNGSLGHKDREILFRHMINQTSCYGVTERPGTAFDYNDWQMALLAQTLFLKVYKSPRERVDEDVLHPLLTDVIGCEDAPTFTAIKREGGLGRLGISVRDFARFGWLYLNEGTWDGRTLIPAQELRKITTSPLPNAIPRTQAKAAEMLPGRQSLGSTNIPDDQTDHFGSYSHAWWTNGVDRQGERNWPALPLDAYSAHGHWGKRGILIVPSWRLVASWNDSVIDGRPAQREAFRRLAAAVRPAGTKD